MLCSTCGVKERRVGQRTCAGCHNEYQKAYYKTHPRSTVESRKRRKEQIRALIVAKKSVPCKDCGHSFPSYVMDFDHVRGKKRFDISVAASHLWKVTTVEAEIAKCDVVCANCHRIRTFGR